MGKGKGEKLPVLAALFCGSHFRVLPASIRRASHQREPQFRVVQHTQRHGQAGTQDSVGGIIYGYHMCPPSHLGVALNLEAFYTPKNIHAHTQNTNTYIHIHIFTQNT